MPANKKSMENIGYLRTPLNTKRFNRVRQLVILLLIITITATAVMAYHFIFQK